MEMYYNARREQNHLIVLIVSNKLTLHMCKLVHQFRRWGGKKRDGCASDLGPSRYNTSASVNTLKSFRRFRRSISILLNVGAEIWTGIRRGGKERGAEGKAYRRQTAIQRCNIKPNIHTAKKKIENGYEIQEWKNGAERTTQKEWSRQNDN